MAPGHRVAPAAIRSWSVAGSAADPETSSRAREIPLAISGSRSASALRRWYMVGTPNNIVAGPASSAAIASDQKRSRWWTAPPRRSGPEHAEDQPVDVEQRQRMGEHVVAGPFPGGGQGVEVG